MALLWIEGFEGFGTTISAAPAPTGIVNRKYPFVSDEASMRIQAGRVSDCSIEFGLTGIYMRSPLLTTDATMCVGLAIKVSAFPSAYESFLDFKDGFTQGMNVAINNDGTLVVSRGSTVLTVSASPLIIDQWHYVEFKTTCHNSTGSYELLVDEVSWLSDSGIDTQAGSNAYHDAFELGGIAGLNIYFDDLYCLDATGSVNNDFLGNVKVVAIRPDGAGGSTDWTPNAGANYAAVNEEELDSDATYVETSTTTDKDLYDYGPLSASSIKGVQLVTEVRVTDASSYDLNALIKSGATEDEGTPATVVSTSYVTHVRIAETNPDTSNLWTPSEVNAAQFGVKAT